MIEKYRFGEIQVNGRKYTGDIKIVSGEVLSGWWRREGHRLYISDIEDILSVGPEIIVVGMGEPGNMKVADELRKHLAGLGIILIEEATSQAAQTFNNLFRSGRNVAGAFHLTC
jgi:hypothetical protein